MFLIKETIRKSNEKGFQSLSSFNEEMNEKTDHQQKQIMRNNSKIVIEDVAKASTFDNEFE